MCNALQRKSKVKIGGGRAENTGVLMGSPRVWLVGIIVILTMVVAFAVIDFGSTLLNMVEFGSSIWDREPEWEREPVEFSAPINPQLWDFGANELTFINQVNRNTSSSMSFFIVDDAIYTGRSWIMSTTNDFQNYKIFVDTLLFPRRIHVINDAVYYTRWSVDLRNYSLYRYDSQTSQSVQIAEEVNQEVIINELLFYKTDQFDSNLYVLNMQTGEGTVVIDRIVEDFIIDYSNERIIFTAFRSSALYQANLDGSNQERLHDDALNIAFNGEIIAITTSWPQRKVGILNLVTNEFQVFYHGSNFRQVSFVGNYLLARAWDDYLYLIDLDDLDNYWIIANDIMGFATIGNEIVYQRWGSSNTYRMNLSGESEIIEIWN